MLRRICAAANSFFFEKENSFKNSIDNDFHLHYSKRAIIIINHKFIHTLEEQ